MSGLRNDASGKCAFARASTAFRPRSRVGDASFWSDRWEIFQKKKHNQREWERASASFLRVKWTG